MSKEHLFPQWLIRRTNTDKTSIRWIDNTRIPALAATLPLCEECNSVFGQQLEGPVSVIFDSLETKQGISESEAEVLVRWLWKISGMHWISIHPNDKYTQGYTMRERVLRPLDNIRGSLILAISLIKKIDDSYGDKPLGIDSYTEVDAIFVSGVFSNIAIMVLRDYFAHLVPNNFSLFPFLPSKDITCNAKLFHPKVGFRDDTEAVWITKISSIGLLKAHDEFALAMQKLRKKG